ncbi:PTS sugar transporter subunit IIC [Lactobacillus sp. ESL0731]|uniref:PTS mannose/fructose/sorbose/N-acetylgalactosamine transporter subunit IIC n=1 Tax=unclassified Lactobacillus TaxID=2620435 RepID=UPI0023F9B5F8|nr:MULTISPECIES: PTS sugar transporter subunit IIC [unclassified Lactobacillus]WEV51622.1 PTS sugar transporter subunit IIC [Lactobacillus sp. ESL0700]WEV62751.1 PTS sugar transporter subunit IIC [Lactobacillus sp. ESL0731]
MKVLILTILAFLLGIDNVSTKMFRRPLLMAPLVGLILGNLQASLAIGATLEIMWMGIGDVGAYMAPDLITGTMISTSLAIMGNTNGSISTMIATAITLAVPTSILAQQLLVLIETVNCSLNGWAKRLADNADVKGTYWLTWPSAILYGLACGFPTFLALQFGAGAIQQAINDLPKFIVNGLSTAGSIIPAVGIALLMMTMLKKSELWMFVILGFVFSSYMKLDILPITLIALVFAFLYERATREPEVKAVAGNTGEINNSESQVDEDAEDYDL